MKIKFLLIGAILVTVIFCSGGIVNAQVDNSALIAQLQAEIVSLTAQIRTLLGQQGVIALPAESPTAWCHTFNTNLGYAQSGSSEVGQLHTALDKKGISYSPDTGNTYGVGTKNAVGKFQVQYGLFASADYYYGYTELITRAKINALYGCGTTPTPVLTSATTPEIQVMQGFISDDPNHLGYKVFTYQDALQKFYQQNSDQYDFIIFFPMARLTSSYSARVNINTTGIGLSEYHNSFTENLQSAIAIDLYPQYQNGISAEINMMTNVMMHEIGHSWVAYIKGLDNDPLASQAHWMNNVELYSGSEKYTHGDLLGYARWVVDNGTAICVDHNDSNTINNFSNLSLYLMGLIGPNQVVNIKVNDFIASPNYAYLGPQCSDNPVPVFTGSRNVSIQDIINANGIRVPSFATSQKEFRVAFVVVAPDGQAVDQKFVDYVKVYAQALSPAWAQATNNLSSITFGASTCTPNWRCSGFGTCVNGQQKQTCTDANNCGVATGEPALIQSCTSTQPFITITSPSGDTYSANNTYRINWSVSPGDITTINMAYYLDDASRSDYFVRGVLASQGYYNFTTGGSFASGSYTLELDGLDSNNNIVVIAKAHFIVPPALSVSCSDYDFNCNGSVTPGDAQIIADLWRNGTVLSMSLAQSYYSQCPKLSTYIGALWVSGHTTVSIEESTRVGTKVMECYYQAN